jgi:hypothetical protein
MKVIEEDTTNYVNRSLGQAFSSLANLLLIADKSNKRQPNRLPAHPEKKKNYTRQQSLHKPHRSKADENCVPRSSFFHHQTLKFLEFERLTMENQV